MFARLYYSYCGYISKEGQKVLPSRRLRLAGRDKRCKYVKYEHVTPYNIISISGEKEKHRWGDKPL